MKHSLFVFVFILFLLIFRIILGIQINFHHEDYTQIYLIGLENATSDTWSYWGPDVVWSETRIPGAMQGILAGVPLRLSKNIYSPLILSNILTCFALVLLSFYAKRRFPELPLIFILTVFLLMPFLLFNGAVLLNTAYLILSGALLFIAVFELFIYRDDMIYKERLYYFLIGFSLLFTYQLHLTWVLFLPFILVLYILEFRHSKRKSLGTIPYFLAGMLLSGITVLPTVFKYGSVMMSGAEGNLNFQIEKLGSFFDLFARYIGMAVADLDQKRNFNNLYITDNQLNYILLWAMKVFAIIQFLALCILSWFIRKNKSFQKLLLLFTLTLLLALFLYLFSAKHLSVRTYILLYPIPLWLSLFVYERFYKSKAIKIVLFSMFSLLFINVSGIIISNYNGPYSFHPVEKKIKQALEKKDPTLYDSRRKSLMDEFN
jgi:hypothetical protein